jgi:hypothetical protein
MGLLHIPSVRLSPSRALRPISSAFFTAALLVGSEPAGDFPADLEASALTRTGRNTADHSCTQGMLVFWTGLSRHKNV